RSVKAGQYILGYRQERQHLDLVPPVPWYHPPSSRLLREFRRRRGTLCAYLNDLNNKRGWTYGRHYGPHDLDNSHWLLPGAKATVDVARGLGIDFIVVPRIADKSNAIEAGRNFLSMGWLGERHCAHGIRCLDEERKARA